MIYTYFASECFYKFMKNLFSFHPQMDADYDPKKARENLLEEVKKTLQGKKRRNRKKKSKLAQLLESEKPKFIPTVDDKSYNEYMEEYYKMDCEDVIGGDLPTRFKYREVVPNDYGLTIEEVSYMVILLLLYKLA